MVVNPAPVPLDESGDKQQQGALRLVEIRDHRLHDFVGVARGDDDLCTGVEGFGMVAVEPVEDVPQGFRHLQRVVVVVGHPLADVQVFFRSVGVGGQFHADVVEAFEGADGGRADGDRTAIVCDEFFDGLAVHHDVFRVHLVAFYLLTLDGLERTRPHMEGDFLTVDAVAVEGFQHAVREVESGRGAGHRTVYFGVHRLVVCLVAFLRPAVEVGGDGYLANRIQKVGESHVRIVPGELHLKRCSPVGGFAQGMDLHRAPLDVEVAPERPLFPFRGVADQTVPAATAVAGEVERVVRRGGGFEAEYFYLRPGLFPEVQACLDDFRVVEDHQRPLRQVLRQGVEHGVADVAVVVDQQLALVAVLQRVFRDASVGESVIIVFDADMPCVLSFHFQYVL